MKKFLRFLSLALVVASPILLSTCKDDPDKPTITSLTPSVGKEGDVVTIAGTFLGSTTKVLFGSAEAALIDPQGGQVTTQVPAGLPLGKVNVTVINKGGTSNPVEFTVIPPVPVIQSINPIKGSSGMSITIAGTYFSTAKSVAFGATSVTALNPVTDNGVTLVIPDGLALGAVNVTITTEGGTSDPSSFTIVGKPTLTGFSPSAGPAGTHVSITGNTFGELSGVSFAGVAAVTFSATNETLIDAVVPAGAATGKIKVTTAGGDVLSANDFIVKGAPVLNSFTPTSGIPGTEVTITGQNFDVGSATPQVRFGGVGASVVHLDNDTQVRATVPVGAASGKITLETGAGSVISTADFSVIGAPTVTTFSPANGIAGASVTINGTNFINVSSVKFNGVAVDVSNYFVNSSAKITAKVPAGATTGIITVTTPAGTGTSGSQFSIIGTPSITSFSPTSGIVGSTITITGTGLSSPTGLKINGVSITAYTSVSSTQITATIPAGATTGKLSVTNAAGTGTSTDSYTVIQIPFIASITPTIGLSGTSLTITGTSLLNGTVKFNSTSVNVLATNTDTQLKLTVPSLTPGAVNVSVVTVAGTSNTKTFTVSAPVPAPVISDLKPATSYKGFPIMIRGSKLKDATGVMIGTTAATILTKYDASMIISIPTTIGNGTYTLTVSNAGGASNGVTLTIITAPSGVGAPPGTNFVSAPPANFVNAVSNFWGIFQLTTLNATSDCPVVSDADPTLCGHITLTRDGAGNVTANYIEITRGAGSTLETLYGQYSATTAYPCIQKLVIISSKDGHMETGTVDVSPGIIGYPGNCTP